MIPKIIHYCWFGRGDLPDDSKKYIDGWKKCCPEYTIKCWNEDSFDIDYCRYVREAYDAKQYAFVSDVARLFALKKEGGVYLDTDVELLQSLNVFLKYNFVVSLESTGVVNTGLIMACENNAMIKEMLIEYKDIPFLISTDNGVIMDQTTNVIRVSRVLKKNGFALCDEIQEVENGVVFPKDVFCPQKKLNGNYNITDNSYAVHHYAGSWLSKKEKARMKIKSGLYQILCILFSKSSIDRIRNRRKI